MAYYQTKSGKFKKQLQNGKRRHGGHDKLNSRMACESKDGSAQPDSKMVLERQPGHEGPDSGTTVESDCESDAPLPNSGSEEETSAPKLERHPFKEELVTYLQMVTSLIEGRPVTRREVLEMLERILRQHRIARRTQREYVLSYLNETPP